MIAKTALSQGKGSDSLLNMEVFLGGMLEIHRWNYIDVVVVNVNILNVTEIMYFKFFFWLCPQHGEVPKPITESSPQQ